MQEEIQALNPYIVRRNMFANVQSIQRNVCASNKHEIVDIFAKNTQDAYTEASGKFFDRIIRDYSNVCKNKLHDSRVTKRQRNFNAKGKNCHKLNINNTDFSQNSQSVSPFVIPQNINTYPTHRSKNNSFTIQDVKDTFEEEQTQKLHMMNEDECNSKEYAEKTTYCRPILKLNNQQFIYKTIERNAKLQQLVKHLIVARQKEKEEESWNNYINDLKNKHKYKKLAPRLTQTHYACPLQDSEIIEDYYKTKFPCRQPNLYRNFFNDIYDNTYYPLRNFEYNIPASQYRSDNRHDIPQRLNYKYQFGNDAYCYPTSSQGRLNMLDNERMNSIGTYPLHRGLYGGKVVIADRDIDNHLNWNKRNTVTRKPKSYCTTSSTNTEVKYNLIRTLSVQTDFMILPTLSEENINNVKYVEKNEANTHKEETFKEKYNRISENVARLKQKILRSENKVKKHSSLVNIENKIDDLIQSVNTFMTEIKANSAINKNENYPSDICSDTNHRNSLNVSNTSKTDTFGVKNKIICGMVSDTTGSTKEFSGPNRYQPGNTDVTPFKQSFYEEISTNNAIKRDIEHLLEKHNNRPCSVQISFDIPTKECSTEVTDSLLKAKLTNCEQTTAEEINISCSGLNDLHRHMTIAVNTDPLGLSALFRISSDALKQLLSYVPNIDYCYILSMLQFTQASRNGVTDYICNICGASFGRPSHLSEHIQHHNLGSTRDCCVCRHVLDRQNHRPAGIFTCHYCGQRFTRAYCCELHQVSCANRCGKRHDVPANLTMLK